MFVALALATLAGCLGFVPPTGESQSVGQTSNGILREGLELEDSGPGFVRARPGESTRYGTSTLLGALRRAAASVNESFPGGAPLRIGDLSAPSGGRHSRHGSHRSGRDADLIFYLTDGLGRSVRGRGWLAFDRFGAERETEAIGGEPASNEVFFFDEARNWHFVRSLITDPDAAVQWIFCSYGVKARLLEYAAAVEPDPEVIFRASWVLHQPTSGHPHNDHFHVRVACTAEEQVAGCVNTGPVWPWIRTEVEKPAFVEADSGDDALVEALLADDESEPEVARGDP
jgi:penicillin-insensitive murein endopeptidase